MVLWLSGETLHQRQFPYATSANTNQLDRKIILLQTVRVYAQLLLTSHRNCSSNCLSTSIADCLVHGCRQLK